MLLRPPQLLLLLQLLLLASLHIFSMPLESLTVMFNQSQLGTTCVYLYAYYCSARHVSESQRTDPLAKFSVLTTQRSNVSEHKAKFSQGTDVLDANVLCTIRIGILLGLAHQHFDSD